MKLLLILFLSFINIAIPISKSVSMDDLQQSFIDKVDNNYRSYKTEVNIYNDRFSLYIAKGIYNDTGCYAISLVSSKAGEYYVLLETQNSKFSLPKNNNGYNGIAVKADITYEVCVYYYNNAKVELEQITLPKFSASEFDETTATMGNNTGLVFTQLSVYTSELKFINVLIITLSILVGIIVITIAILYFRKTGFFNKEKRKEGVVSMRDIYEAETNDMDADGISFEEQEENEVPTTDIPVINPNKRDEDDETNDNQITDVKAYLQENGFVTTYDMLEESEKNKIMMELIKLKNENKISMDAYYKETYELWKK